jgi:hypothetical protein
LWYLAEDLFAPLLREIGEEVDIFGAYANDTKGPNFNDLRRLLDVRRPIADDLDIGLLNRPAFVHGGCARLACANEFARGGEEMAQGGQEEGGPDGIMLMKVKVTDPDISRSLFDGYFSSEMPAFLE